jgi:hypothetical protein
LGENSDILFGLAILILIGLYWDAVIRVKPSAEVDELASLAAKRQPQRLFTSFIFLIDDNFFTYRALNFHKKSISHLLQNVSGQKN